MFFLNVDYMLELLEYELVILEKLDIMCTLVCRAIRLKSTCRMMGMNFMALI